MYLIVPKTWGHEKIIANRAALIDGPGYCLKELTVEPNGQACSVHYHAIKTETFYILSGVLMLELYARLTCGLVTSKPETHLGLLKLSGLFRMLPGSSFTIQPGEAHRFWVDPRERVETVPIHGGSEQVNVRPDLARFIEASTPDNPNDSYRVVVAGPCPSYNEADVILHHE